MTNCISLEMPKHAGLSDVFAPPAIVRVSLRQSIHLNRLINHLIGKFFNGFKI